MILLALCVGGDVEECRWRGTLRDDPLPVLDRWELLNALWDSYTAAQGNLESDHCESSDGEEYRAPRKPVIDRGELRTRRESLENNRHDGPRLCDTGDGGD